jgi:hypothetical protein
MRLKCTECRFYTEEGTSLRCTQADNTWEHWAGLAYKKHPTEKNLRGNCEDYEEIVGNTVTDLDAPREL